MTPFRERNPVVIGIVGFVVIALAIGLALNAKSLPFIGGGDSYRADFTEVGGLKAGDTVRLAGVIVGTVDDLELHDGKVRVSFTLDRDTDHLGRDTEAAIRIRTLLGSMYVSLVPRGGGQLADDALIPSSRTTAPYDIIQAVEGLTDTTQQIDTDQVGQAVRTITEIAAKTPKSFQGSVKGISALTATLAERDDELDSLFKNLDDLTGTVASRNAQIGKLFRDGGPLFAALAARRDAIHQVLVSTQRLAAELDALVRDTRADLGPALRQLSVVTRVLRANEKQLDTSLARMPVYYRSITDATGSGPWLDGFLYNLLSTLGVPGGL